MLMREVGSEMVSGLFQAAREGKIDLAMTWVNVGEVAYIIERRWGIEQVNQALATVEATAVEVVPVGRELAMTAARVKARHALAYADAFAAALALGRKAVLVTGDPEFETLEGDLPIRWLVQQQ
jgi:ribonuclease VapC